MTTGNIKMISLQPWSNLATGGEILLTKGHFDIKNASYSVILYDGQSLWLESLEGKELASRFHDLNPRLEGGLTHSLNDLQKILIGEKDTTHSEFSKVDQEGKLLLKWKLDGGFSCQWTFHFTRNDKLLSEQLVFPMFWMIKELLRRQSDLMHRLMQKDKEIENLEDLGGEAGRKLLTTKFDAQSFIKQCNSSKEFTHVLNTTPLEAFKDSKSQDLYCKTMAIVSTKRCHDAATEPTQPLFDTEIIREEDADEELGTTEDCDSNSSLPKDSPTKNLELMRRAEIKERLEAENERKKAKKRKVKL